VSTGGKSQLVVRGPLPEDLDLAPLRSVVPDFELVVSEESTNDRNDRPEAQLVLAESDLLSLALMRFSGEVVEGRHPLWDPDALPQPSQPPGLNDLATLDRGVLGPLLRARVGDPRWERLAASHASRLQLELRSDSTLLSLGPAAGSPTPRWTLWLRRTGEPWIFEVPAAGRQHRTSVVAEAWWAATQGMGLLAQDARADADSHALKRLGRNAPELVVLRRLTLATPDARVVSINAYRDDENPGGDAVLSLGHPVLPAQSPEWIRPVETLVERAGGRVVLYDASPDRLRFHDPSNPRRRAVDLAGGHYLTAYLGPLYRLRYPPLADATALRSALASVGLPLREGTLEAVLEGVEPLEAAEAMEEFGSLLGDLARYGRTGHPGELGRLKRRALAAGQSLWVLVEEESNLPFLVAERRERQLIAPLSRYQGDLYLSPPEPEALRLERRALALKRVSP